MCPWGRNNSHGSIPKARPSFSSSSTRVDTTARRMRSSVPLVTPLASSLAPLPTATTPAPLLGLPVPASVSCAFSFASSSFDFCLKLKVVPATVELGVGSAVAFSAWPTVMVPAATLQTAIARAVEVAGSYSNLEYDLAAIVDHQGIALQPDFLVADDIAAGRLEVLFSEYTVPEIGVYAVYPSRKHLSGKVRALLDFLAQAFAEQPAGLSK